MSRVAVVTGANQGLGFALTEGLAQQLPATDTVYLTGRDAGRVEQAAARVAPDTPWAELVGPFVDTNNLGATRMLRAFSPVLRPGGRLLVVASDFGTLRSLPPGLHERLDTATMSLDTVDATILSWRDAVLAGTAAAEGWPDWINIPSKVGQVAAVRVLARERRDRDRASGTLIAAVCPGLVDTAASRPWFARMDRAQPPAEAAAALLRLALDPVRQATYGELVQFGRVRPWR